MYNYNPSNFNRPPINYKNDNPTYKMIFIITINHQEIEIISITNPITTEMTLIKDLFQYKFKQSAV